MLLRCFSVCLIQLKRVSNLKYNRLSVRMELSWYSVLAYKYTSLFGHLDLSNQPLSLITYFERVWVEGCVYILNPASTSPPTTTTAMMTRSTVTD